MHIVIDIRTLQIPLPHNNASNNILTKWLSAFLKMPSEDKVTLLVDPRFEWPQLEVPLTGSYWMPTSFKSHPEIYSLPNKNAERWATHKTNDFLLEQKADLFHLTNPFLSAIPVGYPPIACPSVVTVDEYNAKNLQKETKLMQERQFGATYYPKVQALGYCSQIIVNSLAIVNELAPWDLPTNRIKLIEKTRLSPSEIALAIRNLYSKTLTLPFSAMTFGQTTSSNSPFGFTQLCELAAQADTIDHEYTVQSKIPLIGSRIAWLQRSMTTHLREAYFDIIADWQVAFNKKVVRGLELVCSLLTEYEKLLDLSLVQEKEAIVHASQDIMNEAQQTREKEELLNPYILAGPLPEYGNCLGRDFYQRLYLASLHSCDINTHIQTQQVNQRLIIELSQLAQQIEAYYEQTQNKYAIQNNIIQQRESMYEEIWVSLSNDFNILWPEYEIQSDKPYIGWLIATVRRNLTSHLHKSYIDAIFTEQVAFNRLIIEVLCNIHSIEAITLQELKTTTETNLAGKVRYSKKIASIVTLLQKQATSHLYEPYLMPFFERQKNVNQSIVELLIAINKQINSLELNQHYYHLTKKNQFKQALAKIKQQIFSNETEITVGLVSQTELTTQMLPLLIKQMNSLIEERL